MATVLDSIRSIVAYTADAPIASINASMRLDEFVLGLDSLDRVELAMSIEDEFGLADITDEDMFAMKTVQDIVDYVLKRKG